MKDMIDQQKERMPKAFFIASDALAIGALRALQEAGIAVPQDVQIISFNDTSIAKYVYPPLSTVTVFTEEMGKQALQMLDQVIKTDEKIFDILSQADDYVNGEKIAQELGVSRTSIWKAIQKLEKEGIQIESVKNRGYRLTAGDLLIPDWIEAHSPVQV